MKDFELYRPEKVADAVSLLPEKRGPADTADARPMGGGQDLLTEMKHHLVEPAAVVSLRAIPELAGFGEEADGGLRIGATARLVELERSQVLRERWTVLQEAAESVATPQIRTLATVGGNLCQRPRCFYYRHEASPCIKKGGSVCYAFAGNSKFNAILGGGPSYIVHPSDLAPALVALEARVQIAGLEGTRELDLERFFTLPTEGSITRENVLRANELATEVRVPKLAEGTRSTYLKFRERETADFALSSVALVITAAGGKIERARLCLGGVAPIPWRCKRTEELLRGKPLDDEKTWGLAAEDALADAKPLAENGYKVPLTRGLILKAMRSLATEGEAR